MRMPNWNSDVRTFPLYLKYRTRRFCNWLSSNSKCRTNSVVKIRTHAWKNLRVENSKKYQKFRILFQLIVYEKGNPLENVLISSGNFWIPHVYGKRLCSYTLNKWTKRLNKDGDCLSCLKERSFVGAVWYVSFNYNLAAFEFF